MLVRPQTTFKDRLIEALNAIACFDRTKQVIKVAEGAGVTVKTASRYFELDKCPMNKYPLRLLQLSQSLKCDMRWLYDGSGLSPFELSMIDAMQNMTEYEKGAVLRMGIRLLNNDPKAKRAIELFEGGFISKPQFLAMM